MLFFSKKDFDKWGSINYLKYNLDNDRLWFFNKYVKFEYSIKIIEEITVYIEEDNFLENKKEEIEKKISLIILQNS